MNKIAVTVVAIALLGVLVACGASSTGEMPDPATKAPTVERFAQPSPEAEAEELATALCEDVKVELEGLFDGAEVFTAYSDEKVRATVKTGYAQDSRPEDWEALLADAAGRCESASSEAPVVLQIESPDGSILATIVGGKLIYDVYAAASKEQAAEAAKQAKAEERANEIQEVYRSVSEERSYVLNTNTMKFHEPTCSSVEEIKGENREDVVASRNDLLDQGYSPCGRCHP